MRIIDLTHTFTGIMPVFPGDSVPTLKGETDAEQNIVHFNVSTGMHVGTHMDGPLHVIAGARKLSEIPASQFIANGHVLDARGQHEIGIELLEGHEILEGDCILIHTGWDVQFREPSFYENYPDLTEELAHRLVELKIKFIGLDTPSPDKAPYKIHRILLKEEILIIESMCNLSQLLGVEKFEVIALPTKFDAEAAPVRVVARLG